MNKHTIDISNVNNVDNFGAFLENLFPDQETYFLLQGDQLIADLKIAAQEKFGEEGLDTLHYFLQRLANGY